MSMPGRRPGRNCLIADVREECHAAGRDGECTGAVRARLSG
jgi:hypothetical protein